MNRLPGGQLQVNRLAAPITVLGPGRRVGLWLQGCTLGCVGCASVDTWDASGGERVAVADVAAAVLDLVDEHRLTGLSITGGEPLQQAPALAELLGLLRAVPRWAEVDVLLFTGYAAPRAASLASEVWGQVDAVAAGPYLPDRPGSHPLLSSGNQRLLLLTALGRDRHPAVGEVAGGRQVGIQVSATDGEVTMAGLPEAGDLDRFRELMAERGITFEAVSWGQTTQTEATHG